MTRLIHEGKVRNLYDTNESGILKIRTTDRISAFDVTLDSLVTGRGEILTDISNFWFETTKDIIPNHILPSDTLDSHLLPNEVFVRNLFPITVEAIVRGYLCGSGWKDYQQTSQVCGIDIPTGLHLASKLDKPIFTPSTKDKHDQNISFNEMKNHLVTEIECSDMGNEVPQYIKTISLELYSRGRDIALSKGLILADTKFEFGMDWDGNIFLIDECLTPDSSRYWDATTYEEYITSQKYLTGEHPPSYDKQIIRDHLIREQLNGVENTQLPDSIISLTKQRYSELHQRICS